MINWTLIYFGLALLCGMVGFTGLAGSYAFLAEIFFVCFIIMAIISAVFESTPPFTW